MLPAAPRHLRANRLLPILVVGVAAISAAPAFSKPPKSSTLANVRPGETAMSNANPAATVEHVSFQKDGHTKDVDGRILIEAADGGMLLESDDGILWTIDGRSVLNRKKTDQPFTRLSSKELAERLTKELSDGYRLHTTPHYIICYNTSREYAEWASSLYERLYRAFTSYWKRAGIELHEPEFPLVVVAFADRASYEAAAREDLGGPPGGIIGYYSLRTNRVNMYDLTGVESVRGAGNRRGSTREINDMLSQPAAVPLVATVVHEATHQIAFNSGLQTRYADIPLWLCEGMAMYFEAPDLTSSRGWRGIGKVNYPRLETFQRNLPNWTKNSFEALIADSHRFRDPHLAIPAYADAWALNYFLIKYRSDQYTAYLKFLAKKKPLEEDDVATRLAEFRDCFGDLHALEQDFLKQMTRVQ